MNHRATACLALGIGLLCTAPILGQGLPGGGGNAGQPGGIRAVTRRTLMSGYNNDARAMFTAGGISGLQPTPVAGGAPGAVAAGSSTPTIAGYPGEPAVQAAPNAPRTAPLSREARVAMQRLARAGDASAAAALALADAPATAGSR